MDLGILEREVVEHQFILSLANQSFKKHLHDKSHQRKMNSSLIVFFFNKTVSTEHIVYYKQYSEQRINNIDKFVSFYCSSQGISVALIKWLISTQRLQCYITSLSLYEHILHGQNHKCHLQWFALYNSCWEKCEMKIQVSARPVFIMKGTSVVTDLLFMVKKPFNPKLGSDSTEY